MLPRAVLLRMHQDMERPVTTCTSVFGLLLVHRADRRLQCPLCLGAIERLVWNIRSDQDYQVFHLLPLPSERTTDDEGVVSRRRSNGVTSLPRHALYGRSRRHQRSRHGHDPELEREQEAERALARRIYIYRNALYVKHVASNRFTGYKPVSPQSFATNEALRARFLQFVRRELQAFPNVDVAFLSTYISTISTQLDLRSPSAVRLVSEFLGETRAEHFLHEATAFARSPFKSLTGYDRFAQYGRPNDADEDLPSRAVERRKRSADEDLPPRAAQRHKRSAPSTHERDSQRSRREPGHPPRSPSRVPHSPRREPLDEQQHHSGGAESGTAKDNERSVEKVQLSIFGASTNKPQVAATPARSQLAERLAREKAQVLARQQSTIELARQQSSKLEESDREAALRQALLARRGD